MTIKKSQSHESKEEVQHTQEQEQPEIEEQQGEGQEEKTEESAEEQGYKASLEEVEQKLSELKAEKVTKIKRQALTDRRYSPEQIERYLTHIEGTSQDEITASVAKLAEEIPPITNYVDPPLGNTERNKPTTTDKDAIGKRVFERIKGKIFH